MKKLWAVWCCVCLLSSLCWAQEKRFSPQANTLHEEDLLADPEPDFGRSPAFPAQQDRRQPFARERSYSQPFRPPSRDIGPPPTLLDSPSLPMLNEELQGEGGKVEEGKVDTATLSPRDLVALRFVEEGEGILEGGEVERARILFEQAIELAPAQPYSYHFLGRIAFAQGELREALAFLQKAELLFDRKNTEWLGETTCLRGLIAEDLEDFDEARSAYERCLYFTPTNLRAVTALTRLFEEEPEPEFIPQTNVFQE